MHVFYKQDVQNMILFIFYSYRNKMYPYDAI